MEQLDGLVTLIREKGYIVLLLAVALIVYIIINFLLLKNV